MKNPILVLGAGRSSVSLLQYLNDWLVEEGLRFTVADLDAANLKLRTQGLSAADVLLVEGLQEESLPEITRGFQIVISLLPPPLHPMVARACLKSGSNLLTASYESQAMRDLRPAIEQAGLLFMNECGLDPGIDHMSAMAIIEEIRNKGGEILRFHSFCGGLVADDCDSNPFRYKISWNPRNVVLAGKAGARFLQNGRQALLGYQRMFSEVEPIQIEGWGDFEAYPNRDSVPYAEVYGLDGILDLKRGTLRKKGFCERWNVFVRAGMTDEEFPVQLPANATWFDFLKTFFPTIQPNDFSDFEAFCGNPQVAEDILQMGFRSGSRLPDGLNGKTSADFLLELIVQNWPLQEQDRDLVVMLHEFWYKLDGITYRTTSSFGLEGDNALHTAMAKTVGLPLGIMAKLVLHGKVTQKGLALPLLKNTFEPVLKELQQFGVHFRETTQPLLK
jgi:saccharopine dehydrogenase (NADP+, L-glutamate forming)